jgi:glycosyltransferase involved in cell wall biosynthesis
MTVCKNIPFISVIIPTYNSAKYVERTINSVFQQSYQLFEIIIVDDFSSDFDHLKKKIEKYSDNRIKLFRLPKKKNGSAARNFGVQISKGDYIAFLDSDDEWFPEKLEKNLKFTREFVDIDFLLYHKAIIYGSYKTKIGPKRGIRVNERVSDYNYLHSNIMTTCSMFMPKKTALKLLWDERLDRHQDPAYCLTAESIGVKFVYMDEVLTKINWNSNTTKRKNLITWKRSYKFWFLYKELMSTKAGKKILFNNVVLSLIEDKKIHLSINLILKHNLINEIMKYLPSIFKTVIRSIILKY